MEVRKPDLKDIQLSLTQAEAQTIVDVLGNMPTKSGVYPLMMKIVGQAQACLAQQTKGE